MARLSRDAVQKREDFMRGLFEKEPNLSQPGANKLFAEAFGGSKMRSSRVYELRKAVQEKLGVAVTPPEEPAAAGDVEIV